MNNEPVILEKKETKKKEGEHHYHIKLIFVISRETYVEKFP